MFSDIRMSDSDSECELLRVSSSKGHKVAPCDSEYKIKIRPNQKKKCRLLYTLKKGQSLPYCPDLGVIVFKIIFGQDLKPEMGSGWTKKFSDGFWIFSGSFSSLKIQNLWVELALAEVVPEISANLSSGTENIELDTSDNRLATDFAF